MASLLTYFDACALTYRAQASVNPCPPMPQRVGPLIDSHLADPGRQAIVSDLGMLEFQNTLAKLVRKSEADHVGFDLPWFRASVNDVMVRVSTGGVEYVGMAARSFERAAALVTIATRDHGRAFGPWDIIHIITAAEIGYERQAAVDLVTSDQGLAGFVALYPHFCKYVNIVQVDDPGASAGATEGVAPEVERA